MQNEIDTLTIKVETDTSSAQKSLGHLVNKLKELKQTGANNFNIAIKVGNSSKNLDSLASSLNKVWTLIKKIRRNANLKINTTFIQSTQTKGGASTPKAKSQSEPVEVAPTTATKTITPQTYFKNLFKSKNWVKNVFSNKESFKGLTANVGTLFKGMKDGAGKWMGSAKENIKAYKANSKFFQKSGEFLKSIKRIAFYRIIRTIVKMIEQAIKEGTKNLYAFSNKFNGNFAKTMDSIKTQTEYLKNSLATVFAPVLQWIEPFIRKLTDDLVSLFNQLSMAFNKALGNETWTRAIKNAKKYNEELKQTILGFDELNKMNGDESLDFEEVPFDEENLKEAQKTARLVDKVIQGIAALIGGTSFARVISVLAKLAGKSAGLGKLGLAGLGGSASLFGLENYIEVIKDIADNGMGNANLWDMLLGELGVIGGATLIGAAFGQPLIGALIGVMGSGAGNVIAAFIDAFKDEPTWENYLLATSGLGAIGAVIGTFIAPGIGTAVGFLIGELAGAITELVILINKKWDDIKNWFKSVGNSIEEFFEGVGEYFRSFGDRFVNFFKRLGNEASTMILNPFEYVINHIIDLFEWLTNAYIKEINGLIDAWNWVSGIFGGEAVEHIDYKSFERLEYKRGAYSNSGYSSLFDTSDIVGPVLADNTPLANEIVNGVKEALGDSNGGDWTIQIVDENGYVKSEEIITALDRKNRRDGRTIVSVG